jgi:sec-independent protein translocase protein TatA
MNFSFDAIAWMVGPMEMVVIGVVGLLIFGKRIPDLAKSLGRSVVEFKKGLNEAQTEDPKSLGGNQPDILPPPDKRNNNTAH